MAVILIWSLKPAAPARRKEGGDSASVSALPQKEAVSQTRPRTRFPDWGRNPFTLSEEGVESVRGLALEGIVWDEKSPLAVINDRVVGVGDAFDKNRIITITQTEVRLVGDDNTEFSLKMGKEEMKEEGPK